MFQNALVQFGKTAAQRHRTILPRAWVITSQPPEQYLFHKVIFQNVLSNFCHLESYHLQHFIHLSQ